MGRLNELQKAALTYIKPNNCRPQMAVFPIKPRAKTPIENGGFYAATKDEETVRAAWIKNPNANIGFWTNGMIVLDVDRHDPASDGAESLHDLEMQYGELPETWIALTPTGGTHYYFRCDDQRLTNGVGIRPGIDYRGCKGYVLLPPSVHPNGGRYEWEAGHKPNETPLADLPEWLHKLILEKTVEQQTNGTIEVPKTISHGARNKELFSLACSLRHKGLTEHEILTSIQAVNNGRCKPPLEDQELRKICESAAKYERGEISRGSPRESETNAESVKPQDYSDAGNAAAFVEKYGDGLIYTDALGWLSWNGRQWERNDHAATAKATAFSAQMLEGAAKGNRAARIRLAEAEADKDEGGDGNALAVIKAEATSAQAFLKWALQTRNASRIRNMLELSRPALLIKADRIDADPFDLNTPAGIVNLRTGELRAHDRQALCSRITVASPNQTGAELWDSFLDLITCEDGGLRGFLQLVAGMALIGRVYQEGIILAYGSGRNGKSTFFNAVGATLGDYAGSIDVSALTTERQNRGASLATLRGKRLVVTGELEEGSRLSVATLKRLASTDELVIEEKYRAPETIKQTHTLCLFTNHLPRVGSTDAGTWRRLIVVPFRAEISMGSAVQNYAERLVEEAGGAILSWAIEGAVNFYRNGCKLPIPDAVEEITDAYRQREDWLNNFLSECCDREPLARERASVLYETYREYARSVGDYVRRITDFNHAMEVAGFQNIHPNNRSVWVGVRVSVRVSNDYQNPAKHWDAVG